MLVRNLYDVLDVILPSFTEVRSEQSERIVADESIPNRNSLLVQIQGMLEGNPSDMNKCLSECSYRIIIVVVVFNDIRENPLKYSGQGREGVSFRLLEQQRRGSTYLESDTMLLENICVPRLVAIGLHGTEI